MRKIRFTDNQIVAVINQWKPGAPVRMPGEAAISEASDDNGKAK
ncbi:MAG: hypothetical protein RSE65_21565 [Hafnia sp.]